MSIRNLALPLAVALSLALPTAVAADDLGGAAGAQPDAARRPPCPGGRSTLAGRPSSASRRAPRRGLRPVMLREVFRFELRYQLRQPLFCGFERLKVQRFGNGLNGGFK